MTTIDGIAIELDLDTKKLNKGLDLIGKVADETSKRIQRSFRGANVKIGNMGTTIRKNVIPSLKVLNKDAIKTTKTFDKLGKEATKSLKKANRETSILGGNIKKIVGIGAIIALTKNFVTLTDKTIMFQGQLKSVVGDLEKLPAIERKLFDIGQTTGEGLFATTQLFQRLGLARESLGATDEQILQLTDNILKLGLIGGTSGEQLKFVTVQLAQGLANGKLQAQELNSVLEGAPKIASAIEDGMGLVRGSLKKLVLEGKVLSTDIFGSLLSQTEAIEKAFGNVPLTFGRSMSKVGGALTKLLDNLERKAGILKTVAGAISFLADKAFPDLTTEIKQTEQEIFNLSDKLSELMKPDRGAAVPIHIQDDIKEQIDALETKLKNLRSLELDMDLTLNFEKDVDTAQKVSEAITKSISSVQQKIASVTGDEAGALAVKLGISVDDERLDKLRDAIQLLDGLKTSINEESKAEQDAARLVEEHTTAAEKLAKFKKELAELMPQLIQLTGDEAKATDVVTAATKKYEESLIKTKEKQDDLTKAGQRFAEQASSSFADAIVEGEKLSDVINSLIKDLAKFFLKKFLFENVFGAFNTSGGGLGGLGGNASGGTINGPRVVGERGPEIFNPRGPGSILNNSASKKAVGGQGGNTFIVNNDIGPQKDIFAAVTVAMAQFEAQMDRKFANQSQGIVF